MSDVLDGVVRVYNRSGKSVNDLINGTRVIVPPHGSVETSARRAAIMLERHKGVLTSDSEYAKRSQYTKEQIGLIDEMDEVTLRDLLRVALSGGAPDLEKAYERMIARLDNQK